MANKAFCLALLCLALAGCSAAGGSSRETLGGFGPFPLGLGGHSKKESLIEAVEHDPFPKAGPADPRV